MKNGTRIFLITLIVLLLLGYVVAFAYCTYNKYAAAEEIKEETVLNFNQVIANDRINFTCDRQWTMVSNIVTIAGHKYYTKCDFIADSETRLCINGVGYTALYSNSNTHVDNIYTATIEAQWWIYSVNSNTQIKNLNIIDLTYMFGVDNEPNIERCRELFAVDYYDFTSFSPITLNGFDSYNRALNDIFENYKYMLDRNALSTQTQATDLMGTLSGTTNFGYNDENWYILGAMYCPLFTKISAASEFNIEIQLYAPSGRNDRYLCFGTYIDNELNEIYKTTHNGDGTTLNINFTTPIDVQTLYVYQRNGTTNEIEEMNYIVGIFNIRVEQLDIAGAVMSSYSSGYNTARDYYSEGGQGFADIFARGKASGLIEANGTFTAMDYVKTAFITLGEILMIEVFPNFTLGAFFLLPLLTSTIFFIVKLTRGGS